VTWSVTSGKHEVILNGEEIHKSTTSQHTLFEGRFDFTFDIGAHIVQLILHAGKPLRKGGGGETTTDQPWRMYDLFVNGQSFFDFLKVYQLGEGENGISNSTGKRQQYSQYLYRPSVERANHPIRNHVPTVTSEPPDEIQRSRSVNEPSSQRSMSSAHQQFDDDVSLMSYDLPPRSDDSRVPAPPTWEELQGYNFRGLNTPASFERQQSVDSIASQQPEVTPASAAASRASTNGGGDGRVPVVPSVSTVPTHLEFQTGIPLSTKEEEEGDLIDLGGPDLIDLGSTDPTEQFVNVSNGPPITNPLHDYATTAAFSSSNTNSSAFMNVVSPPPPTFNSLKEEQFVNLSDDYPPPPPPPVTKPPSPFAFMHEAFNHTASNGTLRQPQTVRNATAPSSFAWSNGDVSREDIMGRYQNTPSNQPPVYFSTDTSSTAQPPPPPPNMSMNKNHNGNIPDEEKKDDGNNNINDLDNAMKNLVNLNDGLNNPSINPTYHQSRARRKNTSAARGGGHGNIMDRPPSSYSLNELKTMYSQRFNQNQGNNAAGSSDVNEGYYSSVLAGR